MVEANEVIHNVLLIRKYTKMVRQLDRRTQTCIEMSPTIVAIIWNIAMVAVGTQVSTNNIGISRKIIRLCSNVI